MKIVRRKLKGSYGETDFIGNKAVRISVDVKKHKGDKKELADTIKHELMHAKHPKMQEKTVRKAMKKPMSNSEQTKLVQKVQRKSTNYKAGAFKRMLKTVSNEPGALITRMNEQKSSKALTKKDVAIRGLV